MNGPRHVLAALVCVLLSQSAFAQSGADPRHDPSAPGASVSDRWVGGHLRLKLTSGRKVEGDLVSVHDQLIVVRLDGKHKQVTEQTIARSDIREVKLGHGRWHTFKENFAFGVFLVGFVPYAMVATLFGKKPCLAMCN